MERYDYRTELIEDVRTWANENDYTLANYEDREEAREYLNDVLWTADTVTGNGSGSYFFSTWKAEEAIAHNWDLIEDVKNDWGLDFSRGAEYIDVSIRCYLLGEVIEKFLDELEDVESYAE